MRILYFTHSLASCWNHGNAHFLRGIARELQQRGHRVRMYEPRDSWSRQNLLADHGRAGLAAWQAAYPDLTSIAWEPGFDLEAACADADLVIAHEWNDPLLIAALGALRRRGRRFILLFHDTHHRAVSDPAALQRFDLSGFDGVLAFGEALADVYRRWGWGRRVFVWHEAADTTVFRPPSAELSREGLVWVGNWGDDERRAELEGFLMQPAAEAGLRLDVYGVRYPADALAMLARHRARFRGWLPNARVPQILARHLATIHVPRRFYVTRLPGIPTIRVFEALACGIPLASAPWEDSEGLFRPGDFLVARTGEEMARHLRALGSDGDLRRELARAGLETIRRRHSCAHRVDELLAIHKSLTASALEPAQ